MKEYILIVEDEAILFERMRMFLSNEHFLVGPYTPSVSEALIAIQKKRPDLILLDIDLQGKETGLTLGKTLSEKYNIPFIYVTEYNDNATFYKGLATNHDQFLVKTKPQLNVEELLRAIRTVLNKNAPRESNILQKGILGLADYLDELKKMRHNQISKVPVVFEEIAFFTVRPFINDDNEEEEIRTNYLWFLTTNNEYYFLKSSLKELALKLPENFARINESYIINLSPNVLEGRINGSKVSVMKRTLTIKDTYKEEVKNRFILLYGS